MNARVISAIGAVLVAAGLAFAAPTVAFASTASPALWSDIGGLGSPRACDQFGAGGLAIGRWRSYYCEENDKPTGTVWELYADII